MKFNFQRQRNEMDCGPCCLYMISKFHGKTFDLNKIIEYSFLGKEGSNLYGLSDAAENFGFKTLCVEISFKALLSDAPLPCIIHWEENHFVVVTPNSNLKKIEIADPAVGILTYSESEFLKSWNNNKNHGIALLLEPTVAFFNQTDDEEKKNDLSIAILYIKKYRKYFGQLLIGLFIASLIQLAIPFITQSIVDVGISTKNVQYIIIVLLAQLFLIFGKLVTDFIRGHLLLHIGSRINLSILSDFWIKLMRLPVSYFDSKRTGDILQRIGDHNRIQQFLTTGSLSTIFSILTLLIFSIVLLIFNPLIYFIFIFGSTIYFIWVSMFLRIRRSLDKKRFALASSENSATMQLVLGMQELRLNNFHTQKRWEWEKIQASLFKLSYKVLSISQFQQAGAFFINEGKNLFIIFFVAKDVLEGRLTLGSMLAIQSIIGQLNSPIEQLISFMQQAQDAKLSLERLYEIHKLDDEEPSNIEFQRHLPEDTSLIFKNVSFTYHGAGNEPVLKNINLIIPRNKVTAIVGMSGSGKTTLLKLLLKYYDNYKGEILVGYTNLKNLSHNAWRQNCGSVMQEGFIFNDTISNNITVGNEKVDHNKLINSVKNASIDAFIQQLPNQFNTKIGMEGVGISQGQRQRILIARSIYRNPQFIFFDEATNSLDANNEKVILENLGTFFENKTVVVVAHRLSTVKKADKIVVLKDGEIVEEGTYDSLTRDRSYFYELVRNQLELDN